MKNMKGLMKCYLLSSMLAFPVFSKFIREEEYRYMQELRDYALSQDVTLSDLYQDYLEQKENLSDYALTAISSLSTCCDKGKYLDALGINSDTVNDAYAHFVDIHPIHQNSSLYDAINDDIYWDKALLTIIHNSTTWGNASSITLGEIKEKVSSLEEFIKELKVDFPDYDMKMLACNLEECVIKEENLDSEDILAIVSNNQIIYNKTREEKVDPLVDFHEYFHYAVQSCNDINEYDDFSRTNDGIHISTRSLKGLGKHDIMAHSRFQYLFLEEIYADLYAANLLSCEVEHYEEYRNVLSLLQLILCLQENYSVDAILDQFVYQDPVAFIQNFSVYGEDPEKCFIQNCQMLKVCDILLKDYSFYVENNHFEDDFSKEGIREMKKFILDRTEAMFYQNLIVFNETYPEEVSLEDNIVMMNLFYKYRQKANDTLTAYSSVTYGGEYIENAYIYDPHSKEYRKTMFSYLSQKYDVELEAFDYYTFNFVLDDYQFPEVLGEEKQEFYQGLLTNKNILIKK